MMMNEAAAQNFEMVYHLDLPHVKEVKILMALCLVFVFNVFPLHSINGLKLGIFDNIAHFLLMRN